MSISILFTAHAYLEAHKRVDIADVARSDRYQINLQMPRRYYFTLTVSVHSAMSDV